MTLTAATTGNTLPPAGSPVTVTIDGYQTTGSLIGLTRDQDGPKVRVLGRDGLERHIPLPAEITPAIV